jgi:hypothetical protein
MARQSYHDDLPMCEPCFLEFDRPIPIYDGCNDWEMVLQGTPASVLHAAIQACPHDRGWIISGMRKQLNALMIE